MREKSMSRKNRSYCETMLRIARRENRKRFQSTPPPPEPRGPHDVEAHERLAHYEFLKHICAYPWHWKAGAKFSADPQHHTHRELLGI